MSYFDTIKISGIDYVSGQNGIDPSTESLQTIDYPHHEIHGGTSFTMNEVFDLAINNVADIRITTPDTTTWAHFLLQFDTESEYEFWFYETAVISVAGTAYTPINQNRNSATASVLAIDYITNAGLAAANSDTDVTGATILRHGITGAGKTQGGDFSSRQELVLKRNKIYCFRAVATAAGWIHGEFNWYEHVNKN